MDPDQPEKPFVRTGIVCQKCRKPVVEIETQSAYGFVFLCPACGHRWFAEEPNAPKQ